MRRTAQRYFLGGWLLCGTLVAGHAAEPETCPIEPNPAMVDAVIRKLESSGALDQAVERALTRVVKRQQEARDAEESKNQARRREQANSVRPVSRTRDHIRGNPSAEVSLIEYSDFECPFCKRFHGTPKAVLDRFGGRVNWVLRHFPLPFHDPAARREAIAAECAAQLGGNEAFWKYADALFEKTQSNGRGLPGDNPLVALAASLGLDRSAFSRCLQTDSLAQRIEQDLADGQTVGITGTPTTVVRHNQTGEIELAVGAVPSDTLVQVVERLLGARQ
jgi:protein-disulfide isomerase